MAFQTKKSVLAVVTEVTEATPVAPTAGAQFVAIQDGYSLEGSFEQLENAELTGSIGKAKTVQGFESPTAEISHYIKHSGVEGQEPNYGPLLQAAFGAKSIASTEYDTVAGSTISALNVGGGEGATFERGEAVLIKDGVNGYRIRPILSIATDTLNLGFKLPTGAAPALGVNLGKAVLYKPGESHPTLSLWDYRGNEAAVQLMAGARVTEFTMDVPAGEFVNGSFSLEGVGFYFDPIMIAAADQYLDFTDDAGTFAATVAAKTYKDPHELAAALQSAMDAVTTTTPTVTYSNTTGKFTIKTTGTVLSLLWNTGANTANTIGDKIGFSVAADDTGVAATTGYTSDNALNLAAGFTPAFDSSSPLVAKDNQVLLGDATDADPACVVASSVTLTIGNEKTDILSICSESGKSGSVITGRDVSIEITATLSQYDAEKFKRFRAAQQTSFMYAFGEKSGGNWVAGKCACLYIPTATISSHVVSDQDGLVVLNMTVAAYVASGAGECYLSFV